MSGKAFVDTNVAVYLYDHDEPAKQARAREVFGDTEANLVFSTQVLSELYVTLTRKLANPMAPSDAAAVLDALCDLVVVQVDVQLVRDAVVTSQRHQLSYWDALIVESAVSSGCDLVLSEDLADGAAIRGLTIRNPFA